MDRPKVFSGEMAYTIDSESVVSSSSVSLYCSLDTGIFGGCDDDDEGGGCDGDFDCCCW